MGSLRRSWILGLGVAISALAIEGADARAEAIGVDREQHPHAGPLVPWVAPTASRQFDRAWESDAEQALSRSIERGSRRVVKRSRYDIPLAVRHYGMQTEPYFQLQMKREILLTIAKVTGESRLVRTAMSLRP